MKHLSKYTVDEKTRTITIHYKGIEDTYGYSPSVCGIPLPGAQYVLPTNKQLDDLVIFINDLHAMEIKV